MVTSRYEWKFSSGTKIYKQTNNQIRGDKTQKQQIFFKNKVNFVNYCMKRIIFCRNKAQFIKILPFSCMEENDLSNSIWKCVWIVNICSVLLYDNVPAESPSYSPTFFEKNSEKHVKE